MSKKEILNKALENAKTKLAAKKAIRDAANDTVKVDNSRKNRKSARKAQADVNRAIAHIAALSGELAVADAPKTYEFPRKAKTVNKHSEKKVIRKAKRHPEMAKPVSGEKPVNKELEADKAARKELRLKKPTFTKPVAVNEGMADATTDYLLGVAWEEYMNGNENAVMMIRELSPSETIAPSDVDKSMFRKEQIRVKQARNDLHHLESKWNRIQHWRTHVEAKLTEAKRNATVAKGLATKAKNAYLADNKNVEKYAKMIERKKNALVACKVLVKCQKEFDEALDVENNYADYWIEEEDRLNEIIENAQAKTKLSHLAWSHAKRQEALEDAFQQRYERAEWIPEKEDAHRYRMYSIKTKALYGEEIMTMLKNMDDMAANKPAGWLITGRTIANNFKAYIEGLDAPFTVDVKDCVVNNVAASQMSDIMGIEYGEEKPAKEVVSVTYDIVNVLRAYWKFFGASYKEAEENIRELRVKVIQHLLDSGVELVDGDDSHLYTLLASSPSQQKKGQAYMGEVNVLKMTERFREFGWTMEEAYVSRTDNAAEWLKRNSTLTTPSKIIKSQEGKTISIYRVLMVDDVEIDRMFNRVTTVDGGLIGKAVPKKLHLTMFDGQALWLIDGMPSTQMRGVAIKAMAIAKPDYPLPEYATDIMGNRVRVADYDILMTKSCWKAAKMGWNWYQFRDAVAAMAKECPGIDLLRAVRYSDREIGDEENPRNLARQATQQWIKISLEDAQKLTRRTRRWLKNNKKIGVILSDLGEWDIAASKRSAKAQLFNRYPQLVMHPGMQAHMKNAWDVKRNKACSGKLRTNGVYPYICQDPIAMIQICLEGRNPEDTNLGVVPEGMVNLPKTKDGQKVYCVRYPANYIVGMVVKQKNCHEFSDLGNVAVLSYYGDTIVRADGDFDGDEMLFIYDEFVIELMERTIEMFKPTLIDFTHSKIKCNEAFGSKENFNLEIAKALVRAQEFNLVGRYSNLAVTCLQNASLAKDGRTCLEWLNRSKIAHVGAIVCLDMVKGAEVPKELKEQLERLYSEVRGTAQEPGFSMPWNQKFSHPELTDEEIEKRSDSTQDKIAGCIVDDCGEYEVDWDGNEPIVWTNAYLADFVPAGETRKAMKSFVVDDDDLRRMRGCRFEDDADKAVWDKIAKGEMIGLRDFLHLGWHNSARIMWSMPGVDGAEKRAELSKFMRNVVMKAVLNDEWIDDGRVWTLAERYATVVKSLVKYAFCVDVKESGEIVDHTHGIAEDKIGSWTNFMVNTFAEDFNAVSEAGVITDEMVHNMCGKAASYQPGDIPPVYDDISREELAYLADDSICMSVYDDEYCDEPMYA